MEKLPAFVSTRMAAAMIGVKPNALSQAIHRGRVNRPGRILGGNALIWSEEDVAAARLVMLLQEDHSEKLM